ncbi:MAG: EAL domain-containing protein [Proteobacteria bacterium]|nr:EAL domain-containing protein [Pseudomonadota bacterium]
MRAFLNLLFLACYGAAAGVIVAYGPGSVPWLDQTLAFVSGAAVLLGCGLMHEVYFRMGRDIDLRRQLASIGHRYGMQQEDLTGLRREIGALRAALETVSESTRANPQANQGGQTIEEVMAEVKVLKSLIPRFVSADAEGFETDAATEAGKPSAGGAISGALPPGFMPPVAENLEREAVLEIVRAALRNDRIDLVLQPIVSLPQRRRRFYECFSRLRTEDGAMILPEQYIALAERAGLITAIDNMLLFRCIQLVRKIHNRNQDIDFFCNLSPHTLVDEDFFNDFVAFLEGNKELAPHLVFEFAQGDFARWSEVGARLLDRLAALGCRFSLDQVTDLKFDPAKLAARHVRFVKIESGILLNQMQDSVGMLRALRRHQIDLIVEKVEDEGRLLEILDYDIDFGQGFLFGEPRLARPAA